MILTVVGCAGTVPGPDAACSCYLLEHAGYRLLLDLGTGALGPLQRYADPCAIDAVVISHPHRDHYSDLIPLAYLRDRRGAAKRLPVTAPAGTAAHVVNPAAPPAYAGTLDWRTPPAGPRPFGPLTVVTAPVVHSVPGVAVRVSEGGASAGGGSEGGGSEGGVSGASLTYSGDSGECDELLDLARGTDVLLCEAAASVRTPGAAETHLTPVQAAGLAREAGAGHLVLTHLRPWADPLDALRDARKVYAGPITLAVPGLRVMV
ncbi:MBL fold metallo-hydrolase [Actinomadura nitritigenes]|uniref:MBL fold metallo-hydrolase n=1 Tax=Actinomadura nitritigenes TaxID=134602 RepID=UPI003D8A1442